MSPSKVAGAPQLQRHSSTWEKQAGRLFRRLGFRIVSEDVEQGFREDVEQGESGGEGVVLVLEARASSKKTSALIWQLVWSKAIAPAPTVWLVLFIYSVYVIVLVTLLEIYYVTESRDGEILALAAITLLGSAVFLMIGYRLNASYDRWWEARKHWGTITNRTRDVARQALSWIAPKNWVIVEQIVRWTVAYAEVTKNHLRYEDHTYALEGVLSPEDIQDLKRCKHQPILAMEKISDLLGFAYRQGLISDIQAMRLDENMTSFEDELGASERILRTSLPFAYVVHVRVVTLLWLGFLPFASITVLHYFTIPMSLILGYTLLVLEDTGCDIEEPYAKTFNALPLNLIVRNIQNNLLEMLERKRRTWGPQSGPVNLKTDSANPASDSDAVKSNLARESFSDAHRRDSFTMRAVEEDDMARARIRRSANHFGTSSVPGSGISMQAAQRQIVWTGRGEKARVIMEQAAKLREDVHARLRRVSLSASSRKASMDQILGQSKSHHGEVTVSIKSVPVAGKKRVESCNQEEPGTLELHDSFACAPITVRRSFSFSEGDKEIARVLRDVVDETCSLRDAVRPSSSLQPNQALSNEVLDGIPEVHAERTSSYSAAEVTSSEVNINADVTHNSTTFNGTDNVV